MQSFDITDPASGETKTYVSLERADGSIITIEAVLTNPEFLALQVEQTDD